jgi:short-subunit dehydrogenase
MRRGAVSPEPPRPARPLRRQRRRGREDFGQGFVHDSARRFARRYGPWALVAGGSQGMGAAWAEALARQGLNLVLVARHPGPLAATAAAVRERFSVEVREVVADLSAPEVAETLETALEGLELGLLVYNAAVSHTGAFLEAPEELYERLVAVNCRSALALCRRFAERFVKRGRGGILIMSSLAGLQGSPWVTAYGASKAFLINLGEGLAEELRPQGVDVTVVCAGPTLTPNYIASKKDPSRGMLLEMKPEAVVTAGLCALGRKPLVIPGFLNRAARLFMSRILPRRLAVAMMGRNTGSLYGDR